MTECNCTARLCIFSLALALGIVSGLFMMLFAWMAYWYGHGLVLISQWGELYSGYAPTIKGGLIGGAWGFLDGFASGLLIAFIYNLCLSCGRKMCCHTVDVSEVKTTRVRKKEL